jgi:predicted glycogen debranching enzyme
MTQPGPAHGTPPTVDAGLAATITIGREICGDLAAAESREWLCTNGLGGFASGTVAGLLTRRYHGLLVAALTPPLGRTLVVAKLDDTVVDGAARWPLFTNRWADGTVDPRGHRHLERFRLDGTLPVWTYACGDLLVERRVWMEQGASTTYVRYAVLRGDRPVTLQARALVNHRDYHALTRGGGWRMGVTPVAGGLRVDPFEGAPAVTLLAPGAVATPAHAWFEGFQLARERERGLDDREDHLHAGTFEVSLEPGRPRTFVLTMDPAASTDGEAALARRRRHDARIVAAARASRAGAAPEPAWIDQLTLAADQFVVARPRADDPDGLTVIAGYPWFGDWGRDTMIALPGLALTTGRPEVAARILRTFARYVDRGMLPNRFPDKSETPEYNTVDATLWYFEAVRACHAATRDDGLLADLLPVLEQVVDAHVRGTRYGIAVDPADGLLRSGEAGVQLTWMDARIGDRVVTPRTGKAVEINALWYNALRTMAAFARRLGRSPEPWAGMADRAAAGFARFWHDGLGHCHDVIDGPDGDDASLRPNQIFAVSLPFTPLSPERRRGVVDACARHLLTSHGLRSLAPGDPRYRPTYGGDPRSRDSAYHQGTVWGWLLGPFALAHFRVHADRAAARSFLEPMAQHIGAHGLGSIAEVFDGEPPFRPDGCPAQAWSVAETLRAWRLLGSGEPFGADAVS